MIRSVHAKDLAQHIDDFLRHFDQWPVQMQTTQLAKELRLRSHFLGGD